MRLHLIYSLLGLALLAGCNLQKEVELDLPPYEPQVVAECYLQPGQPFLLILSESVSYFDEIQLRYVRDAKVAITHGGRTDSLAPTAIPFDLAGLLLDTALVNRLKPIFGTEIYLYLNPSPVPADYDSEFGLQISLPDGRVLSAVTRILPPVSDISLEYEFRADSLAYTLTRFQDDGSQVNYYRRVLERRRLVVKKKNGQPIDTVLKAEVLQDFSVEDQFFNGEEILFGSDYNFRRGDTVAATIYHLTEDHYRFIDTRDDAIIANLSPFGQPATVYSNIRGGIGIFTGLTARTKEIVIP